MSQDDLMDDPVDTKVDLVSELERLRHRLASRQASEARAAWTRAQRALDGALNHPARQPVEPSGAVVTDARLFDLAPVALLQLDVSGAIVAWNRACFDLLGYESGELHGRSLGDVLDAGSATSRAGLEALRCDSGVPEYRQEGRGRCKDGSVVWVGVAAAAIREDDGSVRGFIVSVEDRSERREVEASLRAANDRLTGWVTDLERRSREHGLVSETGDLLQACRTADEAYGVIARMGRRLFPDGSGSVSVTGAANNLVETVANWGTPPGDRTFGPDACWALRRGRLHLVEGPDAGPRCRHMPTSSAEAYQCVPMMAYGEAIGLLTLVLPTDEALSRAQRRLATTVAEHIALALANLKLQETLRRQSIRDPLTGLFNRRYMEESLEREMRRAGRARHPVGVIMLDLDHFKPFNDAHGHEMGDALLREVGAVLQRSIRGEDIACRYGGEEFILILPEASLHDATQRAEQIRASVRAISVTHGTQPADPVTVSLGVAIYPDDGLSADAVLRAADAALYAAKAAGRNRVEATRRP